MTCLPGWLPMQFDVDNDCPLVRDGAVPVTEPPTARALPGRP